MDTIAKISKASRLIVFFPLISLLPVPAAYRLAGLVSPMDGKFGKRYMKSWMSGMQKCASEGGKLETGDIHRCARQHIKMLGHEALDSFMVPRLGGEGINRLSGIDGLVHLDRVREQGKGVIIVTSHYSRLNMTAYTLGHLGIRNGILSLAVDGDNPYLDLIDRYFLERKLRRYYRVTKGPGLTLRDNPRLIYRALQKKETMVILMDAYTDTVKNFYEVPFLGGTLKLPTGIARISRRTGSPLVYSVVKPAGRWRVKVEIRPVNSVGYEGLYEAALHLERDVLELPCQWWQWAYMDSMWQGHGRA